MPLVTIVAIVIFVGYAIFARMTGNVPKLPTQVEQTPEIVFNETFNSSPSPTFLPSSFPQVSGSVGGTNIDISVEADIATTKRALQLIYPGATKTGDNTYETLDSGDSVYDWYKSQMEQKNFNIRNNIKTRANERFKAVLQGESVTETLKVNIDQENLSAKTIIRLE